MISLEDFHQDFLQTVLSDADSRGLMKPQAFFENVCEALISTGDLTKNYTNADCIKIKKGIEVHGYDYDESRKILTLLVHNFFQKDHIGTLTRNAIKVKFNRLESFYKKCINGFHAELEPTSEAYAMAYNIYCKNNEQLIDRVRLIVFTDGKATRNLHNLPSKSVNNVNIDFRVIDIEYLYKIYLSENNNSGFEVLTRLPYLLVNSDSDKYQSYLACISGDELAEIYEKFGQKLFEQNVRTFLQFKGGVNKGLRNTIEYSPEMFFAYNNGITATAAGVDVKENHIIKIHNLQIVNGAQTTSAIYAAVKTLKQDVSNVSVQIKLSVVKDAKKQNEFVSKVSEYANTQNKINKSDFFSNSPFHKEFKRYSKVAWAPATDGSQHRTLWFYERVRGEYLNEQAYLSPSKKKQFQLTNPKKQLLDKTFLSKSENSWGQKPYIVSKGAQYSFSEFAKLITAMLESNDKSITQNFFKNSICRVIMFKEAEKIVSNSPWYDGGFRAQTVTYSIAYLSYLIGRKQKFLNFNIIWEAQRLPSALRTALQQITDKVYSVITDPLEGHANITQWCKQEDCWKNIKNRVCVDVDLDDLLIDKEEEQHIKKTDKREKNLDNGIEIQSFIVMLPADKKNVLLDYYQKDNAEISAMELDILKKYCSDRLQPPSEKQSKILYRLYQKAASEEVGFDD